MNIILSKISIGVLNNRFAVNKVRERLDIKGMLFEGGYRFTKKWLPISTK